MPPVGCGECPNTERSSHRNSRWRAATRHTDSISEERAPDQRPLPTQLRAKRFHRLRRAEDEAPFPRPVGKPQQGLDPFDIGGLALELDVPAGDVVLQPQIPYPDAAERADVGG